jgi:hypothetical protein
MLTFLLSNDFARLDYYDNTAGSNKGFLGTAQDVMKERGGLYRGFGLKLVRSVPASMIGFVVYEQVAKQLGGASDSE